MEAVDQTRSCAQLKYILYTYIYVDLAVIPTQLRHKTFKVSIWPRLLYRSFGKAYIPTGPTDSFPFVPASSRTLASLRATFFSLQVNFQRDR